MNGQAVQGLEAVPKEIQLNVETQFSICLPHRAPSVSAELRSLADGTVVVCKVVGSVTEGEGERVTLLVVPAVRGRHDLVVTSDKEGIVEGCPIRVFVSPDPRQLGRPVRVIEGVSRPAGMALRGDSEMVVTEIEPAAVCVRDRESGKVITSFQQGSPPLDNPYGVAVDSDGCVYVAEIINCRIHKFTGEGAHLKSVGGEEKGGVAFPAGIRVSQDDQVFVCDDTDQKVHVFDRNLEKLFSFGESGEAPGHFQSPSDVAFGSDGSVLVADTKREKILRFTSRGEFLSEFVMKGQSSQLELGVCVGPTGHLFVSDFWNHQVVVFDRAGQFVSTFGQKGAEPGEFDMPAGIAVDCDGFVYVCDQMNSRIQVF